MPYFASVSAVLALWACQVVVSDAAWGQPASSLSGIGDELIEQYIADLDAQKYDARMAATRELVAHGERAVPPLTSALRDAPSRELQARGLEVLVRIARRTIVAGNEFNLDGGAAESALAELAEGSDGVFSVRARQKLEVLRKDQQQAATEQLARLGGTISQKRFTFYGNGIYLFRCLSLAKGWSGTARDLSRLKYLRNIEAIAMDGPYVSDEYLRVLHAHPEIRLVEIKHGKIQDDSVVLLRELPHLEFLSLYYTPITDNAVSALAELSPQSLLLFGTLISETGREALVAKLPNSFVDYRRGAFLGIGGPEQPLPQSMGCEVNQVAANSAAARAGITLGDIIVSYENKPVRCFEEIREMIGHNAAGDRVQVELLRNDQKLKLMVVLGEQE